MKYAPIVMLLLLVMHTNAQEKKPEPTMDFEAYDPPSTLVVPENPISKAKFPFIDVHGHQYQMPIQKLDPLIKDMDGLNMAVMVNLSGRGFKRVGNKFDVNDQSYLVKGLKNVEDNYPKRFIIFTNLSFADFGKEGWVEKTVKELEEDVAAGANGLKIYKSYGLSVTDQNGNRVAVNDKRMDPIWAKCGALGIPVLIHSADPAQFWQPHDENNERWLELKLKPRRKRSKENPVPWEQIIAEQHDVFKKHPNTKFINAHLGWYGNNLPHLGTLFEKYPNMYAEIGAVIAELGRQPRYANKFLTQYQDRILFGKDSWNPDEYPTYFRVLESEDDYFPYYKRYHAFWRMYGLGLSDEVLKKIYYKNALKVIPGIDSNLFPK